MPKAFWWETDMRKGEPISRHPLLSVLCCTVLYCTILYCTVLYCTIVF